jgi:hypothetical protein
MNRQPFRSLALGVVLAGLVAGTAIGAQPVRYVIDTSSPEYLADTEAFLAGACGYAIDVDGSGRIIVHLFEGNPRLLEIDNYRLFETYAANGKTVVVRPDAGPDKYWIGRDGATYLALTGRSVTGSGVIGRTVFNLDTLELVSSHGRELGDFLAFVCEELAPPAP